MGIRAWRPAVRVDEALKKKCLEPILMYMKWLFKNLEGGYDDDESRMGII